MGKDVEPRGKLIGNIGSNLDKFQMMDRVGPVQTIGTAILLNHALVFEKPHSKHPGYGAATAIPQEGKNVLCLVQELSVEQTVRLDGCEKGYTRKPHPVIFPDGTIKEVDIYFADITVPGLKPHSEYLEIVLRGVREVFPNEYLKEVLEAAK